MTVTNPVLAQSLLIRGRITEPGVYIDPGTGLPTVAKAKNIAFYIDEVASISDDIVNENFKDWEVSLTTPGGETFLGRMTEPLVNRSLGYVHSPLTKKV